eukprot:GHVR01182360.1.p1 GENE.GHVR01182360.1~~GHVR01182360.1.p1  ORF type:complete len:408 (+),score=94.49 GHVR01182360.1:295-1518(+)
MFIYIQIHIQKRTHKYTHTGTSKKTTPTKSSKNDLDGEKIVKKGTKKGANSSNVEGCEIPPQVQIRRDVGPERAKEARNRTVLVAEQFHELQKAIAAEHQDFASCGQSLALASATDTHLRETISVCDEYTGKRLKEHTDTLKMVRIFQADGLGDQSNLVLEEVADDLSKGLQAATIAQSRREMASMSQHNLSLQQLVLPNSKRPPEFTFLYTELPDKKVEPPPPLQKNPLTGVAARICDEIIHEITQLRDNQREDYNDFVEAVKLLQTVSNNIKQLSSTSLGKREDLKRLEQELRQAERQVFQYRGEDDYTELSNQQLSELCSQINKSQRKIATEYAIRELRAQNTSVGGLDAREKDKDLCIVCIERKWNTTLSPCGHVLCDSCGERLNFCPHCRAKIVSRQRCYQP